jgi:uncharacterized protein (DUF2345 family)
MKGDNGVTVDVQKGDYVLTTEKGAITVTAKQKAISITAQQDAISITAQNSTITITANGDITVDPGSNHKVYLGGGSKQVAVWTVAGPSANVFARVG